MIVFADTCLCCRNQLKHIQKIRYVADEADQYERAWLLLADIHIQGGKFDLAQVSLPTHRNSKGSACFACTDNYVEATCRRHIQAAG